MYKVFFNDSTISIAAKSKTSLKDNVIQVAVNESNELLSELLHQIESAGSHKDFVILNDNPVLVWNTFRAQMIEIPAAGGLVINEHRELLFIKRLGVWDLPKGKIEKKETAEKAAVREVEEECGITGLKVIRQLVSTFHIYRSPHLNYPDNLVLKETKWFLMSVQNTSHLTPQTEENIEEVKWFSLDELNEIKQNTYASIHEFLDKTIPFI